jgi:ribosomal protein S12 methylthiotransferase RimO
MENPNTGRPAARAPKVSFVSLGCPKALVDSERIITRLRAEGYELARAHAGADVVVVNTCGFLDSAQAESLEAIGKAVNENGRVIVTGCMGAEPEKITARYPGLLAVTGPQQYESVIAAVHRAVPPHHDPFVDLLPPEGVKLTPRHYAYLKISEGCNNRCSFCIIPKLRGDLVSRPAADVLREAERLVAAGVKELLVISQDTSAYGIDLKYAASEWKGREVRAKFLDLARALGELGVWVRLHYVYPYPHVDDVIPMMAEGKVLPYLDIPFQHAAPDVLRRMKRPAAQEKTLERIARWRDICPELTIRSTSSSAFPARPRRTSRFCWTGSTRPRSTASAASATSRCRATRQRARRRRPRRRERRALASPHAPSAGDLATPPQVQGRQPPTGDHRRGGGRRESGRRRHDRRQGPHPRRRAGDRRRGACHQPPPAAAGRDRHRPDRARGRIRPARHGGGLLAHHSRARRGRPRTVTTSQSRDTATI